MNYLITNGRFLINDQLKTDISLLLSNGLITILEKDELPGQVHEWDAHNQLVLPGMIDLHGDAFERQVLPRPGVHFPTDLALLETDRQMISNGITTAFHGITYSWEPGLRGHDNAFELIECIEQLRDRLSCDTRIHLRWETYNLDGAPYVEELLTDKRIDLLAFNDHIAHISEEIKKGGPKISTYSHRTGLSTEEFLKLHTQVVSQANAVPETITRLAHLAHEKNIACASHDDETIESRAWFDELNVKISEFPVNDEVAEFSRSLNNPVILGAPNVVRNGSHCDRMNATTAVANNLCDVLTSDYYYPSMLLAVFLLMERNNMTLADVWPLVSANAARAAGLNDRGTINNGQRADIVIVDDRDSNLPEVTSSFIGGELVYASQHPVNIAV